MIFGASPSIRNNNTYAKNVLRNSHKNFVVSCLSLPFHLQEFSHTKKSEEKKDVELNLNLLEDF